MAKQTILVATWNDGLFAVNGDACTQEIASQSVRGLASDGRGGALAIAGRHSVCRRAETGEWTTLATSDFQLSCCMAVNEAIYVGTDDARMLRLSGSGMLDPIGGFDNTAGRDTWFAGSAIVSGQRVGPPLGIRSVAANSDGSILFANVHVGGIPRSVDGGTSWQPTLDVQSDVHEVRAHPSNPRIVAAASAIGLCISHDGGATWIIERDGLQATHCSAVAFSGDDILVSASTSPFAAEGKVYRRALSPDGRILPLEHGPPASLNGIVDTGCIATNGSSVVFADRSGNLYVSGDCGRDWSRSGAELPAPSCVLIC